MPRILVVEDEPNLASALGEYLASLGYTTEIVSDGAQAVERATAAPPDAIIMDLMMPRLNGGEAACVLRQHPRTASVPIIAISALGDAEDLAAVLPFDVLLPKPFDLDALGAAVTARVPPRPESQTVGAPAED